MGKKVSAFVMNMYIKTVIQYYYNFGYCHATVVLPVLFKQHNNMN